MQIDLARNFPSSCPFESLSCPRREPESTRWHFSEHYLPPASDRTTRQRRRGLPALHFPRCDCRARRQAATTIKPVASLNTIAPDSSSGSCPATTSVPSKPDCTGSELISCTVVASRLRDARHAISPLCDSGPTSPAGETRRFRFNSPLAQPELRAWGRNCGVGAG